MVSAVWCCLLLMSFIVGGEALGSLNANRKVGMNEAWGKKKDKNRQVELPNPTDKGYLDIYPDAGSKMYYNFFEAQSGANNTTPIVLWLQGGPGCSSLFGMLYICGPYFVNDDLTLSKNEGTWNRIYGLLFIEQPIGVGFSVPGSKRLPSNEVEVAYDLYLGLQQFYKKNPSFANRPLIIIGESYAGKYVPSIAHFIVQAEAQAKGYVHMLGKTRDIGVVEPPVFPFGGMAVGNGFTDAETQTMYQAEVAFNMGLIDLRQRRQAEALQQRIVELIRTESYARARAASDELLAFINGVSGTATLEDVRRNLGYDGYLKVDEYLNVPAVQESLGVASENVTWSSCSAALDRNLRHDVMRSVKKLVADVLKFKPSLFYQGQFDGECGVASNDAWLDSMQWEGHSGFQNAERRFWVVNRKIAGYWKHHRNLSHVVLRNTGHMVPHDNPLVAQLLIEQWVQESVLHRPYARVVTPALEEAYLTKDVGEQACCQTIPVEPPSNLHSAALAEMEKEQTEAEQASEGAKTIDQEEENGSRVSV